MGATFYCRCGAQYLIRSSTPHAAYECEVCHRKGTIYLSSSALDSGSSTSKPILKLLSTPSTPKMPNANGPTKAVNKKRNESDQKSASKSTGTNNSRLQNRNRSAAGTTVQRGNRNTPPYSTKTGMGVLDSSLVPARVYLRIDRSKEAEITNTLEKYYPQLFEDYVGTNGKLNYLLTQVFPEGIRGKYIVSNNQYKK